MVLFEKLIVNLDGWFTHYFDNTIEDRREEINNFLEASIDGEIISEKAAMSLIGRIFTQKFKADVSSSLQYLSAYCTMFDFRIAHVYFNSIAQQEIYLLEK